MKKPTGKSEKATEADQGDKPGASGNMMPDPDHTKPDTRPTPEEEAHMHISEKNFASEHSIGEDHAEPTEITQTTNDTYTDEKYIDVGGGD